MITERTVFILGAGASSEYGFPLGAALVREILQMLSPGSESRSMFEIVFGASEVQRFYYRLRMSDSSSIDTFLEAGDDTIVKIGKAAIGTSILRAEHSALTSEKVVGQTPSDHWLGQVWNALRSGCTVESFAENELAFVTFNYDRVLEYYFTTVVANAFGLPQPSAESLVKEAIPIVHLHGTPEKVEFGDYGRLRTGIINVAGEGIRVVHDTLAEDDPAFRKASAFLTEAKLVVLLGFGYHPVNLTRLRLSDVLAGDRCELIGTAYLMGEAEIASAKQRINRHCTLVNHQWKCGEFLRQRVALH